MSQTVSETMSTNISDLPGPSDDVYETPAQINYEQHQRQQNEQYNQKRYNEEDLYDNSNEINMNIKKNMRENFDIPGIFDILRKEVTEENMLIFVMLFLATTHNADDYTRRILSMLSFDVNTSNVTITLIKCASLLLIYIIVKNYVLPYIKV